MATMSVDETQQGKKYLKLRRIVQTVSLIALNPWILGNSMKSFCVPVMNCWSCPAAAFACPIGAIGYHLAAGFIPFLVIGIIIAVGALIGRLLCGWICPFGFMQDLIYKIKSPKFEPPRVFRFTKYAILLVFVFIIGAFVKSTEHPAFFCSWCPAGTLEAALPVHLYKEAGGEFDTGEEEAKPETKMNIGPGTPEAGAGEKKQSGFSGLVMGILTLPRYAKFWILAAVIIGSIFMSRFFCRVICPIGALFGIFNFFSFYRLGKKRGNCKGCGSCYGKCTLDPTLVPDDNSAECIRCFDCLPTSCELEYEIEIRTEWCKRCGVCSAFCPGEVFSTDELGRVTVAHPENCTGCGWCTKLCPDFGITVKPKTKNEPVETVKPEADSSGGK